MAAATTAAVLTVLAIVSQDQTALRAAPSSSAATHAQLWSGELLEVRGRRLDHLQVYDHRLERAGYIRTSQARLLDLRETEAPQLLTVARFLRDTPGAESLGIAYVAAYLKAAPAAQIDAEPFDALGVMAERLALRAGARQVSSATLTGQLEVAAQYGVKFTSYERNGTIQLCYDGEAFRRIAAMAAQRATPEQRARAALALTRHECLDPALRQHERQVQDRWRATVLDALEPAAVSQLDELTRNRLRLRRAGVWAAIAFGQARRAEAPQAAAQRAIDELAAVNKTELGDEAAGDYTDAALRVGAVRWAAVPSAPSGLPVTVVSRATLQVQLQAGEPGQTCVRLLDATRKDAAALAERCTYATVWAASANVRPDGRALALAVQPVEGWTELWLWRQTAEGWVLDVLPPMAAQPGLGYVELAGWAPPAQDRLLLVREARSEGRVTRRFEVLRTDTLVTEKSAGTAQALAVFTHWADPAWRTGSVSLR
ncbi:MAG: hypothetical protein RLY71_2362 [Pseudomonadota bacterium]|jgi:hypothetical protein